MSGSNISKAALVCNSNASEISFADSSLLVVVYESNLVPLPANVNISY